MRTLLLAAFYWVVGTSAVKANGTPVVLVAKSSEQLDTTGCNVVKEVTRIIYQELSENRIKIWDSQQKDIPFTITTIQSLEKSAGMRFIDQETMFIYERWTQSKREVTTTTVGFYFAQKDKKGNETVFGYVDYADLQPVFAKTRIQSNASGNYSTTFETLLKSKHFNYQLLQLGDKVMRTANEAQENRIAFVGGRVFNESSLGYYPPDKSVTFFIDHITGGEDGASLNGVRITKLLEEYFIRNMEVYYNMGGDRITSHLNRNKIKVTQVVVNEIWRKVGSEILYEPKSVTVFVNDSALNEINGRNIGEFEFRYGEYDLFGFIRTREFNYVITRINSEEIELQDSYLFQKGLLSTDWNKLNRYVTENQ